MNLKKLKRDAVSAAILVATAVCLSLILGALGVTNEKDYRMWMFLGVVSAAVVVGQLRHRKDPN